MSFMQKQFQALKKKESAFKTAKERWVGALSSVLLGDTPRYHYADLDGMKKFCKLIEHVFSGNLTQASRLRMMETFYRARGKLHENLKFSDEIGSSVYQGGSENLFLLYCFYRLNNPKRKFYDSLSWLIFQSLKQFFTEFADIDFSWSKYIKYAFQNPNGLNFIRDIDFKLRQEMFPGNEQTQSAIEKLRDL